MALENVSDRLYAFSQPIKHDLICEYYKELNESNGVSNEYTFDASRVVEWPVDDCNWNNIQLEDTKW
jgi:hypothetical protein